MMAPRFIADAMLGRLARWLRLLGYDTIYEAGLEDAALVHRSVSQGRILLTRDHRLVAQRRLGRHLLIEDDRPLRQLRQVFISLGLPRPDFTRSRCTQCNEALTDVPRSAVARRVPPYVASHHEVFRACPACHRAYWEGTHMARMREAVQRALE